MKKCIWLVILMPIVFSVRAENVVSSEELFHQAKSYQGSANYEAALQLYHQLIMNNECVLQSQIECVRIYADLNDILQAKNVLNDIIASEYPSDLNMLFTIAHLLLTVGEVEVACAMYERLYAQHPEVISIMYNIGYIKKMMGDVKSTVSILKKLLAYDPENDTYNFALGHTYLFQGDFVNGWHQHDRFLRKTSRYDPVLREWLERGELAGKRILLRFEGGLGDTVQFIRTAQWLHEKGAIVFARIQKPLIELLSLCPFIDLITSPGDSLPAFDASATLMTMPALFNTTEELMGNSIPYIFADASLMDYWGNYVAHDEKFKIGICWQANVHNDVSRLPIARRGIPLKQLLKILSVPNVSIYILQKKEGLDQLQSFDDLNIHYLGDSFDEDHGAFVDTVALMKNLDLVISVDTVIPHLAGALGVPVWLLLPYSVDWRWINNRTDSPWYPTMQIFKQPVPFDWDAVMDDVVSQLQQIVPGNP